MSIKQVDGHKEEEYYLNIDKKAPSHQYIKVHGDMTGEGQMRRL